MDSLRSGTYRAAPHLFDIRATSATVPEWVLPDELMIDWGIMPKGCVARIYWPAARADDIIAQARQFYGASTLRKTDDHTIHCETDTVTYVPIPRGAANLAGMLTLDFLPGTVRDGQQFEVVVRRVSWRFPFGASTDDTKDAPNWRYVVGAFQVNVPVGKPTALLPPEESVLALYKWKVEQLTAEDRWRPVLHRHNDQVSARVRAFGGAPDSIKASPTGGAPGHRGRGERIEYTGDIVRLAFDPVADFEGFLLLTKSEGERAFVTSDRAIALLAREACEERIPVSVFVEPDDVEVPVLIVLHRRTET